MRVSFELTHIFIIAGLSLTIRSVILLVLICIQSTGGVRFIVIGDWGTGDESQSQIAEAMNTAASESKIDFIVATGDNFYPDGVESPTDSQFEDKWRNMYNQQYLNELVWYISVGNHDHRIPNGEWYQVEFGRTEARWYMPGLVFNFTVQAGSAKAVFISFDSQSIIYNKEDNNPEGMKQTIRSVLADNSDNSIWKFAFAHHPAYSCGTRSGSAEIRDEIITIMEEHNADVYFAGHEHNLQHLRKRGSQNNLDHVTSGGGGRGLYGFKPDACDFMDAVLDVESLHFAETHGFCVVDLNGNSMTVSYRDQNNMEIYTFTRTKSF